MLCSARAALQRHAAAGGGGFADDDEDVRLAMQLSQQEAGDEADTP